MIWGKYVTANCLASIVATPAYLPFLARGLNAKHNVPKGKLYTACACLVGFLAVHKVSVTRLNLPT